MDDDYSEFIGKVITAAESSEDDVLLSFGARTIRLCDDGQSCCERRYMRTDDDLRSLVGKTLARIEEKDGPDLDDGEVHETRFLAVVTEDGDSATFSFHNEHNGYYGGFSLAIREVTEYL